MRNLSGVRSLDPVILNAPRRTGVSDGVVVVRNEIREVCLHALIRQRTAILVVLARAANLEVGGVGRVGAEVHAASDGHSRYRLVVDLRLARVHRVVGKQTRHHRAAGGAVRAVFDAVLLEPRDHVTQSLLVILRHSRQIVLDRQRVLLRAALGKSIPRGKNCLVPCLFLHAQLVALILRHRVVVRFELVDELNRRAVELRQIFGEFRHLRPEIGKVLRVRFRGLGLERFDAGLRSQLRRVSGSSVLCRVDAVHAGLVERFDRLPIGLREALLRIVRILIRFLELGAQIVLDLREVCLRFIDLGVDQDRAAGDERAVFAVKTIGVDQLPARLIDGHGKRAVRAGLELRVGQDLSACNRIQRICDRAAEDMRARDGLCLVVRHVGGHGCLRGRRQRERHADDRLVSAVGLVLRKICRQRLIPHLIRHTFKRHRPDVLADVDHARHFHAHDGYFVVVVEQELTVLVKFSVVDTARLAGEAHRTVDVDHQLTHGVYPPDILVLIGAGHYICNRRTCIDRAGIGAHIELLTDGRCLFCR